MRVAVIGSGVLGASAAFHLARAGASVTIVDAGPLAGATSPVTFGWVNANGKSPEHYFELNRAGMRAHDELAAELPGVTWLHSGGSLEWADTPEGAARLAARAEESLRRGYPVETLDAGRLAALEPDLAAGPGAPRDAVHFTSEKWADTVLLATALLGAAVDLGARLVVGDAVVGIGLENPHGTGATVCTASGERWEADAVVNASGVSAVRVAALVGLDLASEGTLGITVVTAPAPVRLGRVVRTPAVHVRPDGAGRVMLGSPRADAVLAADEAAAGSGPGIAALAASVVEDAAAYFQGLAGVAVEAARVGRRVVPRDNLPVVGVAPQAPAVYHLFTHSGVTLGPLLGRLVAREIVSGNPDAMLAPYRPSRFQEPA
jgi:glycine/D-amino acid oxidase-like deaminating enzyme